MSSYLALKLRYIKTKHIYTKGSWKLSISSLSDVFSYLEEMKNYYGLSVSRTVNQLIMRVRMPTVAYKLALQEKPQGSTLVK